MNKLKQKKETAYNQSKVAEIMKPFEKLEALLNWSIYELSKKTKNEKIN